MEIHQLEEEKSDIWGSLVPPSKARVNLTGNMVHKFNIHIQDQWTEVGTGVEKAWWSGQENEEPLLRGSSSLLSPKRKAWNNMAHPA